MKTIRMIVSLLICVLLCASSALAAELTLTTNGGVEIDLSALLHRDEAAPTAVYFISDITPESLVRAYQALGVELPGKVGVKLSTGESENSNYLRPALIGDLVRMLDAAIVECNTAYGGSRASTAMHLQLAKDHGFTDIAEVDILDAEGSMELPIEGGNRLSVDYVGSHFANYDAFLVLSHFKGHAMAGFGGAIKNISIGFGSSTGKVWIHSGGTRTSGSIWGEQDPFLDGRQHRLHQRAEPPVRGLRLRRQPRRAGHARRRNPRLHRPAGHRPGGHRPGVRHAGQRVAGSAHREPQRPAYAGCRRGRRAGKPFL